MLGIRQEWNNIFQSECRRALQVQYRFFSRRQIHVAFDPKGDLWVTDPANGAVIHYDSTGTAVATYNTANGLSVLNPVGLTFAPDGTLYVADATGNKIVKFKPQ